MFFLVTAKGVMRGDVLFKLELFDLFHVKVQRECDSCPLHTFILQFATDKTSHGAKSFGRVASDADVTQCPVGSVVVCLCCWMSCKSEMENPCVAFTKNESVALTGSLSSNEDQ